MANVNVKYGYNYIKNKDIFIVYYYGGLIECNYYYRSDTKEWTYLSYEPKDPDYQKFKELINDNVKENK